MYTNTTYDTHTPIHRPHIPNVQAKSLQSCPLCNPMDCSPPGSSVHGILQARVLEWIVMPPPEDLSNPGIEPTSLMSPTLAGGFFTTSAPWEAHTYYTHTHTYYTATVHTHTPCNHTTHTPYAQTTHSMHTYHTHRNIPQAPSRTVRAGCPGRTQCPVGSRQREGSEEEGADPDHWHSFIP